MEMIPQRRCRGVNQLLPLLLLALHSLLPPALGENAPAKTTTPNSSGQTDSSAHSTGGPADVAAAAAAASGPQKMAVGTRIVTAVDRSAHWRHNHRNCSLTVQLRSGSVWEYENCIYLPQGGGFTFHWTYDRPTQLLDASFSAEWSGWLGWGMGVRMIGSSALVAYEDQKNSFFVDSYFLPSYNEQDILPGTGNLLLLNNTLQVHIESGKVMVMFAMSLPPEESNGFYMIFAKGPSPSPPAAAAAAGEGGGGVVKGRITQHDPIHTAKTYLRLSGGGAPQWLQSIHGAINLFAWGLILPSGALVARHTRDLTPSWLRIHRGIQVCGAAVGFLGFVLGLVMWQYSHGGRTRLRGIGGEEEKQHDPSMHQTYAITLIVLTFFQVTALLGAPHKEALLRPWWNFFHHWTGRVIIFLAILNIWEGIALVHPKVEAWSFVYGVPLGLLVVVASVLEAFHLWKWLMDDAPTTSIQRYVQSLVPPTVHRHYSNVLSDGDNSGASDGEIEIMASKIRRDLEYKYT